MSLLVATNVVASRPPKRRPTGTPHARAKRKEKNGVFSGHYVIASNLPPERLRPNDDRWNAARSCQLVLTTDHSITSGGCCLVCSCWPALNWSTLHSFFFIRTKFIRTPTLRLLKKTKNNSRLQKLLVLRFDLCSYKK